MSDTFNRPSLTKIEKSAVDQSVWYPAVVTTLMAGNSDVNGNSRKSTKQSNSLFLYPVLHHHQQLTRSSVLRTELRVARTIGVVVGCFTACWLPFTIIYVLQVIKKNFLHLNKILINLGISNMSCGHLCSGLVFYISLLAWLCKFSFKSTFICCIFTRLSFRFS